MAKTLSFQESLVQRAKAFRPLEDKAANDMRKLMLTVKKDAASLISRNMVAHKRDGKYIDSPSAIKQAELTIHEMDRLLKAKLNNAGNKLVEYREEAYRKGAMDVHQSVKVKGLSTSEKTSLAGAFNQVNADAAVAARTRPVLGILPDAAFNGIKGAAPTQVRDILTSAILSGESTKATAQRIADAMDMSVSAAERIVRTNMNAAYNDAAKLYYESRPDIFSGYRWDAVLDDRTSPTCLMLHGSFWPLDTAPPGPPAHWNCRSVLIGVFKDGELEQLQIDDTRTVREYKKDKDGELKEYTKTVPATYSPEAWLHDQPYEVVQYTLGSKLKADAYLGKHLWEDVDYQVKLSDIIAPNLTMRSNKAFIERVYALAEDADARRTVTEIAKLSGVDKFKHMSAKSVLEADNRAIAKAPFDQPQPVPSSESVSTAKPVTAERYETTKEWIKSLSDNDREDWRKWFSGGYIPELRQGYIRGKTTGNVMQWGDRLEKSAAKSPVYDRVIYRGLNLDEESVNKMLRSKTWTNIAPNSTSKSRSVATDFATGGNDIPVLIEIRGNKYGIDVQKISGMFDDEKEVWMPRNTTFRIIERTWTNIGHGHSGKGWHIVMEAVD